jgi:hypothetical protein
MYRDASLTVKDIVDFGRTSIGLGQAVPITSRPCELSKRDQEVYGLGWNLPHASYAGSSWGGPRYGVVSTGVLGSPMCFRILVAVVVSSIRQAFKKVYSSPQVAKKATMYPYAQFVESDPRKPVRQDPCRNESPDHDITLRNDLDF